MRLAKSGTNDPTNRPQILRSCSSYYSRASRFPSRFIRTMRLRTRWVCQNGKTEAWYVLSAAPEAKVALGLSRRLTPQQLRAAIDDGSISDLIVWRAVSADDVIFVPAGTIHAIGAGLVIAELQQRSDTTFRLFDHGRKRELHIENAIAVADAGPAAFSGATEPAYRRTETSRFQPALRIRADRSARQTPHWCLEAERETWFLVLSGGAIAGSFDVATGEALFAQSDHIEIHAGASGMVGLMAYTGGGTDFASVAAHSRSQAPSRSDNQRRCRWRASLTQAKGCREEWPPGNH